MKTAQLADPSLPAHHRIVIDALDEIDGKSGSDFLHDLLDVVNEHRLLSNPLRQDSKNFSKRTIGIQE